jgi:prepilin-type processing-associated H-X9-DG protein
MVRLVQCPRCGVEYSAAEQLQFCQKCGAPLRIVCPRCQTDNPGNAPTCSSCGLALDNAPVLEAAHARHLPPWLTPLAAAVALGAAYWFGVLVPARQSSQQKTCQSHLHQLAAAMQLYAQDNNEFFPPGENWVASLQPYVRKHTLWKCPARTTKIAYAFNANLQEQPRWSLTSPSAAILLFESRSRSANPCNVGTSWLKTAAHPDGYNLAYADGHVAALEETPSAAAWNIASVTGPVTTTPAPTEQPESGQSGDEPAE